MNIGNQEIKGNVFLAPLAGVSDIAFRIIAMEMGAAMTYTEMVSANGLYYGDSSTNQISFIHPAEKNVGLQLFGHNPAILENVIARHLNPRSDIKILDFNMGCPAPKIVKNNDGSALLRDTKLVRKLLEIAVKTSNKPVTLKYRLGFDENSLNYLTIGKIAEDCGVSAVTLHGRTREQYYSGKANWEAIRVLKQELTIPVFGNGDVYTVKDIINMFKFTGVDGVLIARGAMGNPFIFKNYQNYVNKGYYEDVEISEIVHTIKRHYDLCIDIKGERTAIREMRKHIAWYLKGLYGANKIKNEINKTTRKEEVFKLLDIFLESSDKKRGDENEIYCQ